MEKINVVKSSCGSFDVLSLNKGIIHKGDIFIAEGTISGEKKYIYEGYDIEEKKHVVRNMKTKKLAHVETKWFDNVTRKTFKI